MITYFKRNNKPETLELAFWHWPNICGKQVTEGKVGMLGAKFKASLSYRGEGGRGGRKFRLSHGSSCIIMFLLSLESG